MLNDIFTALIVVSLVGLVFGILLALVIRFFGVEDDERTKSIRAALPGVNCGACGFTGCNEYAVALAKGETTPNKCIPGSSATAQQLGEILGVTVEQSAALVAFVHCNGDCGSAQEKAICDGISTCKARASLFGGSKACSYGCLGCGDCTKVCASNAICIVDGIARIDTSRCLGCGLCAKECPKKIISMIPQNATSAVFCSSKDKGADARKLCKNACIGCKKCEKTCPAQAITVINNCALINYEKCNGCGLCTENCPTACLKSIFSPIAQEINV